MYSNSRKLMVLSVLLLFTTLLKANQPDSAYIFAYSTLKNGGKNGLHLAWSIDQKDWHSIGPEHRFVGSDYGTWGGEKRMYAPYLLQDASGTWHCLWTLNDRDGVFAHASSPDLVNWKPQLYPEVVPRNNCLNLEASLMEDGSFRLTWLSTKSGDSLYYESSTRDFIACTPASPVNAQSGAEKRTTLQIKGEQLTGTVHKVAWSLIDDLLKEQQLGAYQSQMTNEHFHDDPVHFKADEPIKATVVANVNDTKAISDELIGIFFEDINYAADGGLYAEMVQNRGFEYNMHDKKGRDASWISTKAWSLTDSSATTLTVDTVGPIHPNNPHYAVLTNQKAGAGLANEGFGGMVITKGDKYRVSLFAKNAAPGKTTLQVRIVAANNQLLGEKSFALKGKDWKKLEGILTASADATDARLEVVLSTAGSVALDMISLFPEKTYMGHKNGLRPDLAQTIADLHPKFVRFPGGCVVHGDGLHNIYKWKNTIGPLEARKPNRNIWNYHQSYGLGFYEYFQFCEDLGATPIPVIAAGVPCQNSSDGGAGQQGGVPMEEMDEFIQDILDLIEYANGSAKTEWGRKRAEAGHPKPFHLKYIGIGNEDLISEVFKERFAMINKAIQEKYPDIVVIGTVGPFYKGSDYEEGWRFATELGLEMVDEHYYENPGWFINNQDYYDKYSRDKAKVYLGEYASRSNKLYNALAEAVYLTAIERNADVVHMASYAPLLAKHGNTQWGTDMVFFNNSQIHPTPSYYVQKMFGQHAGDAYLNTYVEVEHWNNAIQKRVAASVVKDSKTGEVFVKLVNVLPGAVETVVDINMDGLQPVAMQVLLHGDKNDRKATPVESSIDISNGIRVELPPYSFVVLRLSPNPQKK